MIFKDNSVYYGSFINSHLSSQRAVVNFSNGDKFKGQIESDKRTGHGEYWYADKSKFEGGFSGDLREGPGTFKTYSSPCINYVGEYKKDKRCGQVDEFSVGANKEILFKGTLDEEEQFEGEGQIFIDPINVHYKGSFAANKFHGEGYINHKDTGAIFEGSFNYGHKHGPCKFTLKEGYRYHGEYKHGIPI